MLQLTQRGRRPGSMRVPLEDFKECPREFSGPRRDLNQAARVVCRDGLAAVRASLGVSTARAAYLLATALAVPRKRVLRWCWCGFSLGKPYAFGEAVEKIEDRRVTRRSRELANSGLRGRVLGENETNRAT